MECCNVLEKSKRLQVITLCQQLIRERSYSGEEEAVAKVLQQAFGALGYDDCSVDRYGNVVGVIRGKRPGKRILLDGHLDTVPVPDWGLWKYEPFGGELVDGRVYGRGASDMKGAVAAMACAGSFFAAETDRDFAGEIHVAGVVHEECFEGIAAREISQKVRPDYVVIGEASELKLKIGQRGRAEIVVETFGKPAHSANPQKGVNAVYRMARLIEEIRRIQPPDHAVLGPGILELTDIKSSPYPGASVVPDYCRATYDRRLLVGETKPAVLAPIQKVLAELQEKDPTFRGRVGYAVGQEGCYTGEEISGERFFPGWLHDKQEPFIRRICDEFSASGLGVEITHYSFCTNGSHYAGEAGIPTIGFGPSRENHAHTVDEYIEVDQLTGATVGYCAILRALLTA